MYVGLLLYYILVISIPFDYCTDYYLKIGGTNSASCTTYSNPCGTLDYIMQTLINNTKENHTVYIDTGTHNYTIISSTYLYDSNFYPLVNVIFTLTPYISSSSSFSSSNIDTYPVILTNTSSSSGTSPFVLSANISSSFHYLKFLIGKNSYNGRYFIYGFCFYLFFIYIYIL
jgi:hypothetical protein